MITRFLQDSDYDVLIRDEIEEVLLEDYSPEKRLSAEKMAIAQVKNYLKAKYDIEAIFQGVETLVDDPDPDPDPDPELEEVADPDPDPDPDPEPIIEDHRDYYMIMITIDCTLYHLYSSIAPNRIPEHRSQRYEDALKWLRDVGRGTITADLPLLTDDEGQIKSPIRIESKHKRENHRW